MWPRREVLVAPFSLPGAGARFCKHPFSDFMDERVSHQSVAGIQARTEQNS